MPQFRSPLVQVGNRSSFDDENQCLKIDNPSRNPQIFQIKYFGTKPKNLVDRNIIKMSDFQRFVDSMLQFRPPLVQLGNRTPETEFKSTLQGFGSFLVDFNVHKHCLAVPTESQNLSYHSWMCPFPRTRLDGDYVVLSTKVVMELDPCSGQI